MELGQRIANGRRKKGLTQEQLADLTGITVRTVQRIESGASKPRSFTLKAVATVLEINYNELTAAVESDSTALKHDIPEISGDEDNRHFLLVLCLSCFSYLVLPFVHFLIPRHMLKNYKGQQPGVMSYARKLIRGQLYWLILLWIVMLATLAYNIIRAVYFEKSNQLNYLVPFFVLYALNAVIISAHLLRVRKMDFSPDTTL